MTQNKFPPTPNAFRHRSYKILSKLYRNSNEVTFFASTWKTNGVLFNRRITKRRRFKISHKSRKNSQTCTFPTKFKSILRLALVFFFKEFFNVEVYESPTGREYELNTNVAFVLNNFDSKEFFCINRAGHRIYGPTVILECVQCRKVRRQDCSAVV